MLPYHNLMLPIKLNSGRQLPLWILCNRAQEAFMPADILSFEFVRRVPLHELKN